MNYLGLDYGEKKIGLALSAGFFAKPFLVLDYETEAEALLKIKEICDKEAIDLIVLGFPKQDEKSEIAVKIEKFHTKLREEIGLEIILEDETLTSQEALQKMLESGKGQKKRHKEDAFAAAIILQNYLDKKPLEL